MNPPPWRYRITRLADERSTVTHSPLTAPTCAAWNLAYGWGGDKRWKVAAKRWRSSEISESGPRRVERPREGLCQMGIAGPVIASAGKVNATIGATPRPCHPAMSSQQCVKNEEAG